MASVSYEKDLTKGRGSRNRLTRYGLLFFLLMPLLGIWWILITKVPVHDFASEWNGWIINPKTRQAILPTRGQQLSDSESWEQEVVFDWQTGRLKFKTFLASSRDFGNVLDVRRRIYHRRDGLFQYVASDEGNESIRSVTFPSPKLQHLVQNRYAVGADANTIYVCDLEAKQPEVVESPAGNKPTTVPLVALEGTPHFLRIRSSKPATCAVEVYAIDPDARARKVATWKCRPNGLAGKDSVRQVDGMLVSIGLDGKSIVYRSADGSILETVPLQAGIDLNLQRWFWQESLFFIETSVGREIFDLKRKRWLPSLRGRFYLTDSSPSGRYHCFMNLFLFDDELKCKIVDAEAGVIVSSFQGVWPTKFLDEQTLLDVSAEYGFTFRKIDVQTGEVLQTWQPLWWVPAMLFIAIVGYLGWSFAWLKMLPTDRTFGVWCQVFLIAVLPIAAFVFRLRWVGDRLDFSRSPIQFAQAIVLALLLLGTIWMIHAHQRIIVRFLPLLMAVGVMSIAVSICFSESMQQAVPNALMSLFPISVYMLASLVARRCGYRVRPPASSRASRAVDDDETKETNASIKTSTITITDMFLLTTLLAILFAGISPWLPSLGGTMDSLSKIRRELLSFCILSLMPVLGWWLCFWSPGFKRPLAAIVSLVVPATLLLMLFADACYQFFGTNDQIWLLFKGNPPKFLNSELLRLEFASLLSAFWLALVFRLSGWQWTR